MGRLRRLTERPNTIEVEQLVREFKKVPRAVDGIGLRVDPGKIYGFLGPDGDGKSTTVPMLTTSLPPTAGRARAAGPRVTSSLHARRDPTRRRRRRLQRVGAERTLRCRAGQRTRARRGRIVSGDVETRPGGDYRFRLDGDEEWPDPCSRFQPAGVRGPSRVVDAGAFEIRPGPPLRELVVYELHVGRLLARWHARRRDPASASSPTPGSPPAR